MQPDPPSDEARERQDANVKRTVAVSALRKMRDLVDEWEADTAKARRMTPYAIALICLAVVAVLVTLFVYRIG